MSKYSFFSILFLLFLKIGAQILNPGFENWSGGNPQSWQTTNSLAVGSVTQETVNPGSGNASVIITTTSCSVCPSMNLPGKIGYIEQKVPYVGHPDSIQFMYKSNIHTGDQGMLLVSLSRGGQLIGNGMFMFNPAINTSTWTVGSFSIYYNSMYSTTNSDSISVLITPSDSSFINLHVAPSPNPSIGSQLIIDNINILSSVGIEQFSSGKRIGIYPNPSEGIIFFTGFTPDEKDILLEIQDVFGQIVLKEKFSSIPANFKLQTNLNMGSYSLIISVNNEVFNRKLIIIE